MAGRAQIRSKGSFVPRLPCNASLVVQGEPRRQWKQSHVVEEVVGGNKSEQKGRHGKVTGVAGVVTEKEEGNKYPCTGALPAPSSRARSYVLCF